MIHHQARLWITLLAISGANALSAPIRNLVFTEVIKDVMVLDAATKQEKPAKVGDTLVPPNVLKTGPDSRAELVAEDQTVTRIGSNTVFSVEAESRDVNISKGSVLFHSPKGKGGGTIKSAGATASVLGTTLIVGANQDAGFKVMLLEGKGEVKAPGSSAVKVGAGQLSFAMPGQKPSVPLNFELKGQVGSSKLVNGFSKPVASIAKINAAIDKQQAKIANGDLAQTDLAIGDRPDTAFKLDSTTVTTVTTIQQKIAEKEVIASRSVLDPRYVAAVSKPLSLTTLAVGENIFGIDGSGANKGSSYGLPKGIPGNRSLQSDGSTKGAFSTLIASEINFEKTTDGFFLPLPVNLPSDLNHAAIVSLGNINIASNLEFVGLSSPHDDPVEVVNSDGTISTQSKEEWRPLDQLLLSAGKTITIASGSVVRADVPVFEIYAAGSSFTDDVELAETSPTSPRQGISWNGVHIVNGYSDDLASDTPLSGIVRITAPSISLNQSAIDAGRIELTATDELSIDNSAKLGAQLPSSFLSADDLALNATDSISLTSKNKSISLKAVNLNADQIDLNARMDITLEGALAADVSPTTTQTVTETKTVIKAQAVRINSDGSINMSNLATNATDPSKSSFDATAANEINLKNVNLTDSQKVALAATTIVLADTKFGEGSAVSLASRDGKVAAEPGTGQPTKNGMVNFIKNVYYGPTEIKFSTEGKDVAHADFQSYANKNASTAGKLGNITIAPPSPRK